MIGRRALGAGTVVVSALLAIAPAQAQETRREAVAAERAARARTVAPYTPGSLERLMLRAQRSPVLSRFFRKADGPYAVFGSVTRGGGLAFGGGWREHVASERVLLEGAAAYTVRGYHTARAEIRLPRIAAGRVEVGSRVCHRYFPQEDYFGLGPASRKEDRVNYLLEETEISAFGIYRPTPWLSSGLRVAHLSPDIRSGTDSRYPSIESRFTEQTAPGLADQPGFIETGGYAEADFRDHANNPKSGGRYTILFADYSDRDAGRYDFARTTAVAEHHFPIFDKKRVFSVRAVATHLDPGNGGAVPFYYMPALGGRDTLRGLLDYRFRDHSWMLLNAEYRWEAVTGIEMAIFYDIGDVESRFGKLSLADARSSYGIGTRFGTTSAIVLRTEVAFGSGEGTRAFVAVGAPLRIERYLR